MKADFGPERSLVWLASYPKSGNTWLRAMLAVLIEPDAPIDLDNLPFGMDLFDRELLDDFAAIASADMTARELIPYQARLFRAAAREADPPCLVKTHAAVVTSSGDASLFPPEACAGAVYLVRDPRDVAVSYAHHDARSFDATIERMGNPATALHHWDNRTSQNVPQAMGTWSEHVRSWTTDPGFPVLVLRYEDMLADPAAALAQVAQFCGLDIASADIARAVEASRFDRLRAAEDAGGFREKPSALRSFFRAGRCGDGLKMLSRSQIDAIVRDHGAVMRRFGYLQDEPENLGEIGQ